MKEAQTDYAFRTQVDLPFEAAVEEVTAALKKEGFGILTEIDVQATLKEKINADFRKYVILGACNPPLAYQAFNHELEIGLLLPCNVIVYEDDDQKGSVVSIINPMIMLDVASSPNLASVANKASNRLQQVISTLGD